MIAIDLWDTFDYIVVVWSYVFMISIRVICHTGLESECSIMPCIERI